MNSQRISEALGVFVVVVDSDSQRIVVVGISVAPEVYLAAYHRHNQQTVVECLVALVLVVVFVAAARSCILVVEAECLGLALPVILADAVGSVK